MSERDDTETESLREERGGSAAPDPRERLGEVPIAPHSAGIVGGASAEEPSTADEDREQAESNG